MNGGRTKKSVLNIFYRLSSQIINIILKFVSRTIFIYVLGVEYLGINGLFSEILSMLSLADLGFGTAMVFSMYEPLAKGDEKKVTQLIGLYKKIYTTIALAILVLGVVLIPFLKYLINLDKDIPCIYVYYLLYLANTVSSYLVVYKTCILNADQKNYLVSKYNMIFNILSTFFCSVFLIITKNFLVYLIIQVAFTYLNNFYCSYKTEKMYPYIKNSVEPLPEKETKSIFDNVKSVFIYKFSTTLVGSTDNTIISILLGTAMVGYYANYSMVISNITIFINIIFSSITASIGNLIVENNDKKNYYVYRYMQFFSFIISVVSIVCVFVLINDFIVLWIGEKFTFDRITILAIALNMYFSVVLMPIWSYREATGMYRQTKYVMLLTALVNIVMSFVLGKIIGLAGILFATTISRLTTYFWYEPKLLFKQYFNKSVVIYYKSIFNNFIILISVGTIVFIVFQYVICTSWIGLIIKSVLVGLTTLIITIMFYLKNDVFISLKQKLLKK